METNEAYERKLESKLEKNNVRDVWSGMKLITRFRAKGTQAEGNLERANELNIFTSLCTCLQPQSGTGEGLSAVEDLLP